MLSGGQRSWGQGCSRAGDRDRDRAAPHWAQDLGTGMLRRWQKPLGGCSALWEPPSWDHSAPTSQSPVRAALVSAQRCPAAQLSLRRCFPPRHCPSRPGSTSQPVPNAPRGHELLHLLAPNPAPRCQLTLAGLAPGIAGTCCAASVIWGPRPSPGATPRGRGVGSPSPPLTAGAVPAVTGPWLTRLGARCRRGAGSPAGDSRIPRSPARAGRVGSLLHPGWPPPVVTVPSAWWLGNPWG